MFAQLPPSAGARVLEVGAGIGTFSARILAAGAESAVLVEPEPACVAELRSRFAGDPRVDVRAEVLPEAPSLRAGAPFDVAIAQNVLEHIEDDGAAVAAMAAALRPGGRLMALVPAHPRLYGSLDREFGHERRYTRQRLRSIVRSAGLEIDRLYAFNALGILGWWARSLTGGRRIGASSLRVYEALLAAWRPIEERVELPVGLSLVVQAHRP